MQIPPLYLHPERGVGRHVRECLLGGRDVIREARSVGHNLGSLSSCEVIVRAESVVRVPFEHPTTGKAAHVRVEG